jgi:ABC-type oligopeptide transport system substrate-binding subunit
MKLSFGSQYNCPTDYFLNLDVRKAWTYAFDYPYYMDEILGNKKYGVEVGSSYAGVGNLQGLPFQVPESELQNVPVYNLTYAKQLLQESGEYDTAISIPFPISPVTNIGIDNQTQFAVARAYAYALNSIDPNIVITPVVDNSSAPSDAYQIGFGHWYASAPAPYTFIDYWYRDPFAPHWLNSTGHPDQAAMFAQMNSLIAEADSTTNATLAAQDYEQIEQIGINLYLYVYLDQPYYFLVVKPYMNGYQGQVSYVLNPMIYTTQYAWWVKTCGSIQACSGRSIGP